MLAAALLPSPLLHAYDTPPPPVTEIAVVVQLRTVVLVLFAIEAVGKLPLEVIVMLSVSVRPFAPVAVTM
jgi:hypothetical protein